jgi:prepilin-type N-terminal cleavage/methylation domain-containing protein
MSRRRGFTLIELLVVIIIIAVMSVGIVPAYQRFLGRVSFDALTGDVAGLFAEARNRAVTDGTEVDVRFDRSNGAFALIEQPALPITDQPVALQSSMPQMNTQSGSQNPAVSRVVQLGRNYAAPVFTPGSGTAGASSGASGGSPDTVRFRDDGTCDGATLTLLSSEGYSAQFVVLPATGRIQRIDVAGQQVHP